MTTPINAATSAYAAVARLATKAAPAAGAPAASGGAANFTSLLKDAMSSVTNLGHTSDAQTRAMANGKANMVDVVTAVSETEVAIGAVVAVRDKVIAAYEDIMKMPI
jgi:flagellar hook-basal body complex protein FliE